MSINPLLAVQPPKQLRDYQLEALEVIKFYFYSGLHRRVLLALPTGTGKTVTFVELIAEYVRRGRCLLGATATPERGDKVGLNAMFQKIAFQRKLLEMIEAGWLCDLRAIQVKLDMDTNKLHTLAGDFKANEAAQMLMQANAPKLV